MLPGEWNPSDVWGRGQEVGCHRHHGDCGRQGAKTAAAHSDAKVEQDVQVSTLAG